MTDYKIILQQFNDFCELSTNFYEIKSYLYPTIQDNSIGVRTSKFTINNYVERYSEILSSNQYTILFYDESVISFFYTFNDDGSIQTYNLSFIPSVDSNIDIYDFTNNNDFSELLLDSYSDYIRIDYDTLGYREAIHTENHMHNGIYDKTNDSERKEFRFPLGHIIYPYDFIYIICKYIYHSETENVYMSKLLANNNITTKRSTLSDVEANLFYFNFNNI